MIVLNRDLLSAAGAATGLHVAVLAALSAAAAPRLSDAEPMAQTPMAMVLAAPAPAPVKFEAEPEMDAETDTDADTDAVMVTDAVTVTDVAGPSVWEVAWAAMAAAAPPPAAARTEPPPSSAVEVPAPAPEPEPSLPHPAPTAPPLPETTVPPPRAAPTDPPVAIRNEPPRYPRSARARGDEGTVCLRVYVLASGAVGAVRMIESSGHASLDRAAVRAARRWRFEAARRDGRPVDMWIEIPVQFDLQEY